MKHLLQVVSLTVCYRVFAHELSVRTNHLDARLFQQRGFVLEYLG